MVGIGVVGCGNIANMELESLKKVKNAKLVAVADVNIGRAKEYRIKYGAEAAYGTLEDMLKHPGLDGVLIITPPFLHAEHAITCAKAGKHIVVQKPFTVTIEEANRVIKVAKENNVKLMASFNGRFRSVFIKAKEILASGLIGQPLLFRTQFSHGGEYKPFSEVNWFYDPIKSGGGAAMELAVHHFDIIRWFSGSNFESITADVGTLGPNGKAEDAALINCKLRNGNLVQLFVGLMTKCPPGSNMQWIEVYGTDGTLILTPVAGDAPSIRVYQHSAREKLVSGWQTIHVIDDNGFAVLEQEFVDAIIENREPSCTGIDGLESIRTALAVTESAKTGRRILL